MLWLSLHREKFPLLADNMRSAAGTAGKQRWALILPSSARVSQVTDVTIIGVRYPELDTLKEDMTCFGNYLFGMKARMVASYLFSRMRRYWQCRGMDSELLHPFS